MNTTIKLLKIGLFVITAQLLLSGNCKKENTGCFSANSTYNFAITSEWDPQNAVYSIGDTLALNSNFPKTLADQINPSLFIDYSGSVGIGGNLIILKIDTVVHTLLDAVSSFNYFTTSGQLRNSETKPFRIKDIYHAELSTKYDLKTGIIAKERGIFLLYVTDFFSNGIAGKKCTKADFGMTVTNTNKHYELYQYAMQQEPDNLQKKTMYCFRVQ
jgi:hypothetical protein